MSKCREESCPIDSLDGKLTCILHADQTHKSKELLREALDSYTKLGAKLISNAQLAHADFSGLEIQSKKFKNCNMKGAHFFGARLIKVGFDYCAMDDADFQDIIMVRLGLKLIEDMD